jgi:hypothetical protein
MLRLMLPYSAMIAAVVQLKLGHLGVALSDDVCGC